MDPLPDVTVGSVGIPKPGSLSAVLPNKGRKRRNRCDHAKQAGVYSHPCTHTHSTNAAEEQAYDMCPGSGALQQAQKGKRTLKANLCFYGK